MSTTTRDQLNLVFFGSGAFGVPTLAQLAQTHKLHAIVTQPDKPAGRGGRLTPTPIAQFAAEHLPQVPVLKPEKCNDAAFAQQVRAMPHDVARDAWVVIAYGQYLGKKLLADRFAINLHASLLPKWRGAAPIHASLVAGDSVTGNSVITLADKMDAGFVLGQTKRQIGPTQTTGELHDALASDGPALVEQVLQEHAAGTLTQQTQDESLVTIASKMTKADGAINWAMPADAIRAKINGLNPWPGVTVMVNEQPLKLLRAAAMTGATTGATNGATQEVPGVLVDASGLVSCGDGLCVQLLEVQPANKKPMAWQAFQNGARLPVGAVLCSMAGASPE